jgi:hypothetical protein
MCSCTVRYRLGGMDVAWLLGCYTLFIGGYVENVNLRPDGPLGERGGLSVGKGRGE